MAGLPQSSLAQLSRELGQPQDGGKVAQARDGRGHEDRADGTAVDGADRGRGGDDRRVPAPYASTAGRLPYALQPSVPHLTRSALHRCLQRHGILRLPDVEGDKHRRQKFKRYPIGFFHIRCPAVVCPQTTRGDIAEVQTAEV